MAIRTWTSVVAGAALGLSACNDAPDIGCEDEAIVGGFVYAPFAIDPTEARAIGESNQAEDGSR